MFSKSVKFKEEYCVGIVRIDSLDPIEGSDFLVKATVSGFPIVVRKDEFNIGDCAFYAMNETQLNEKFLSKNNLYEFSERERNSNCNYVQELIDNGKNDEAKKNVGFFNKHGRVKMIRLRGCPSMGFIFGVKEMAKWKASISNINLEDHVGEFFDTIDGELFVKAYVPYVPPARIRISNKKDKKIKKFNRMIPGEFNFHYDTGQLQLNIHNINPDTKVVISNKIHGTSAIFANVLVKKPLNFSKAQIVVNKAIKNKINKLSNKNCSKYYEKSNLIKEIDRYKNIFRDDYTIGYGNVYSSRGVIKNQFINKSVTKGFYEEDVWSEYNTILKKYIPEGMSIYGEIYGYLSGNSKMIQKNYDYGCESGSNELMIYRISMHKEDGSRLELNVNDVYNWTVTLLKKHPELKDKIHPIDILYYGTLKELYPELDINDNWNDKVLDKLKNDKEHFGMEELEPLCKNKVPREGIVVRIDDDPILEAFKLKCIKFLEKERDAMDKGEVDMEMQGTEY